MQHVLTTYWPPRRHVSEAGPIVCQFLPRDAMRNRGLCYGLVSVCPSVCLSVCHVRAFYPDG